MGISWLGASDFNNNECNIFFSRTLFLFVCTRKLIDGRLCVLCNQWDTILNSLPYDCNTHSFGAAQKNQINKRFSQIDFSYAKHFKNNNYNYCILRCGVMCCAYIWNADGFALVYDVCCTSGYGNRWWRRRGWLARLFTTCT